MYYLSWLHLPARHATPLLLANWCLSIIPAQALTLLCDILPTSVWMYAHAVIFKKKIENQELSVRKFFMIFKSILKRWLSRSRKIVTLFPLVVWVSIVIFGNRYLPVRNSARLFEFIHGVSHLHDMRPWFILMVMVLYYLVLNKLILEFIDSSEFSNIIKLVFIIQVVWNKITDGSQMLR